MLETQLHTMAWGNRTRQGGGGVWHDTWVFCGLQLAAPICLSPLTAALPLNFASIGGGAHRPLTTLCPPSPCLAYLYLSTPPSFPLGGCANGAPGLSLFHCSVSGPHREGHPPSPLARCVQVDTPAGEVVVVDGAFGDMYIRNSDL